MSDSPPGEPAERPVGPRRPLTRRTFLRRLLIGSAMLGAAAGGTGLAAWLATRWCEVTRTDVAVEALPAAFEGFTVALLADTHFGPFVTRPYLESVAALTNAARPDLILLGGDFVQRRPWRAAFRPDLFGEVRAHAAEAIGALAALRAPHGVFAVLGNHDHWEGAPLLREAFVAHGIAEWWNAGRWIERGGERAWFCGVDDLWEGCPDLDRALAGVGEGDCAVLLAHNPDFAERFRDRRVRLMLSGHTHGGQVRLPGIGALIIPSIHGKKYEMGLVKGPVCPVYVTRGVGVIFPPVRFRCPPEVAILRLRRAG